MNPFRALMRQETEPLPAAVQILKPGWFTPLNPSLPGAGDLSGTIRTRVPVDRLKCEWAPGIEPDEADFEKFDCELGEGGVLTAQLRLNDMAASVGGETFAPEGPEGKAVTVRIRAYTGGQYGEDRRVFAVHRDPAWMEGFPVSLIDRDGDGMAELIAVSGGHFVHAYRPDGSETEGWPKFTYGWHMASPAFGDLDGDGLPEMVVPVREGRIFAWRTAGSACCNHPWPTFHHDNQRTGNLDASLPGRPCP